MKILEYLSGISLAELVANETAKTVGKPVTLSAKKGLVAASANAASTN